MDSLPPPPPFNPVLKRERPTTGDETNPEIVKRKILDYYENLTGKSFDYGRMRIRDFVTTDAISLSKISRETINKFLITNGDAGINELEHIKANINLLDRSGARDLFKDEPLMQEILDKLVSSIPVIDSVIKSYQYKIPVNIQSGKDDYGFYKKYLKYKEKYLELKNKLKK